MLAAVEVAADSTVTVEAAGVDSMLAAADTTRLLSAARVRVSAPHIRASTHRVPPRQPRFGRRRRISGPTARAAASGQELPTRPIGTTA